MAAIPLPNNSPGPPPADHSVLDPLQEALLAGHGIEVPVTPWPAFPKRLLRISAQLYNSPTQYQLLAEVLPRLLHPA